MTKSDLFIPPQTSSSSVVSSSRIVESPKWGYAADGAVGQRTAPEYRKNPSHNGADLPSDRCGRNARRQVHTTRGPAGRGDRAESEYAMAVSGRSDFAGAAVDSVPVPVDRMQCGPYQRCGSAQGSLARLWQPERGSQARVPGARNVSTPAIIHHAKTSSVRPLTSCSRGLRVARRASSGCMEHVS